MGGGGWGGGAKRGRRLGFARTIRRRGVDERGGGVGNTMGSEAGKQSGDVFRIRDSESAVKTVVGK